MMRYRLRLSLAIAFLVCISITAFAQRSRPVPAELREAVQHIENMTAIELAKEPVGSVTIGIVSGPDLIWTRSFGYADMEKKILATSDSVYRIGSITKQFTALVLLQLVEDGKVHLTDQVEKYLPELSRVKEPKPWSPPITLIQLATMTSGMGREPANLPTYLKGPVSEWMNVMLSALPEVKYDFEPDTHYSYSNIGYAMLGASLSRAAGKPFVEHVMERIFLPLGMEHTAFEPNSKIQPYITKGYAREGDGRIDAETPAREHDGRGYKVPNGAMYTTVGDLAKFVAFEMGEGPESVLKKETWLDNLTRVNSASGDLTSGYGVGFRVSRQGEFVSYGHGGSVSGYRASALFDPVSKTGAIVLRNVGGRLDVGGLCLRALRTVVEAKAAK
jgi:CubicO group peptidase (beta-lactamase class C family)